MKDFSLHSGERYSEIDLQLIGPDHLARYRYVADVVGSGRSGKFGADIFCGSGYGSALIARETEATVLAIDGSEEAIVNANKKFTYPNLIYAQKYFPFELPISSFDFIASMESIEHIKEHELFFYILQNALKPDGDLFISAPNEDVLPLGDYKWHFKHFRTNELVAWAKKYGLSVVNIFSTKSHVINSQTGMCYLNHPDAFYPQQINNHKLFRENIGETNLYHFKKSKK